MFFNKYVYQQEESDCAAAALSTLFHLKGYNYPLYMVKKNMLIYSEGTNIYEISQTAERLGFHTKKLTGNINSLKEYINNTIDSLPLIAHISKGNGQYHFVVILKATQKRIIFFDPAIGRVKMDYYDFEKIWENNIIILGDQFKSISNKTKSSWSLIQFVEQHKFKILSLLSITIVASFLSIISSKIYQGIVDQYIIKSTNTNILSIITDNIVIVLISFTLIILFQNILLYLTELSLIKLQKIIEKNVLTYFYSNIFKLPMSFFQRKRTGDFITRIQDIENVSLFLSNTLIELSLSILLVFIGAFVLININYLLFIIVIVAILIQVILSIVYIPIIIKNQRFLIEKNGLVYSSLKEYIDAIEHIKLKMKESDYTYKIGELSNQYITLKRNNNNISSTFNFSIKLIDFIKSSILIAVGIYLISKNLISFGEFLAFESLMLFFTTPIKRIVDIQIQSQEFLISSERLLEFFDEPHENYLINHYTYSTYDLRLDNVSYSYNSNIILEHTNILFNEGENYFIKGSNGSGKTTFLKLLVKLILPNTGNIYLGDSDYKDMSVTNVRSLIAYSSASNFILRGTIGEILNINYLSSCQKELFDSVISMGILDNILNKGLGINTLIYTNGTNLSEGQKQILNIVTLLISNKPIIIFDECMSKIDLITKQKIIMFITIHLKKSTCILIEHNDNMLEKICSEVIDFDQL